MTMLMVETKDCCSGKQNATVYWRERKSLPLNLDRGTSFSSCEHVWKCMIFNYLIIVSWNKLQQELKRLQLSILIQFPKAFSPSRLLSMDTGKSVSFSSLESSLGKNVLSCRKRTNFFSLMEKAEGKGFSRSQLYFSFTPARTSFWYDKKKNLFFLENQSLCLDKSLTRFFFILRKAANKKAEVRAKDFKILQQSRISSFNFRFQRRRKL